MVNRLVSVGDDFTLPPAVNVADNNLPARLQAEELSATYVPKWKANTAYLTGDAVLSPAGDTVTAKANFTSGASYSAANWDLSATVTGKLDKTEAATTYDPLLLNSQKTVRNRDLFVDAVAEGAPTDGVTDAQPKIGASHNLLPATGGRVALRKGSYLMSTRLIVTKQGMVLEGDGIGATTLLLNAAGFQVGASDALIRNLTIKGNGSNARSLFQLVTTGAFKNWRFENVKFDGVSPVVSRIGAIDNAGAAITSAAGLDSFVEFDGCEFTNYTEDGSLHVRGTHHVTISRSWFHNAGTDTTKGDLLKLSAGAEYWKVLNNRFTDGARDAIDGYDAQRGQIEGNTIVNMGVHGIELKVASATAPNPADRTRVTNNHVVNIGTATASPAMQLAVSNVIATGNMIEGGTSYGMRCGKSTDNVTNSKDIIWANNHVKGTASHGYMLNGVDGAIIQGNAAINCGGSGFSAPLGTTNSLIVGGAANNLSRGNTSADVWA
ncbi:right-handed parallel beta-helix repeat-containing protein [Pseudarthrobacter oxydans]|uniref:right-handed parallel beta-helix repeat-containing protein n=1 Tax=Pseudarthrobacter oxydans TaxID=1671 RepID=UPI003ED0631D